MAIPGRATSNSGAPLKTRRLVNLGGSDLAAGRWTRRGARMRFCEAASKAPHAGGGDESLNHRPPVFVFASAVGLYATVPTKNSAKGVREDGGFSRKCVAIGSMEAKFAESAGIRTVLLRLGIVLGRGGGALAQMAPVFRSGLEGGWALAGSGQLDCAR